MKIQQKRSVINGIGSVEEKVGGRPTDSSIGLERENCWKCMQPKDFCFCRELKPFDPCIEFVILTHPLEFKRRITTGRMAHLALKGSTQLVGVDFSESLAVRERLNDPGLYCVLLYPGESALYIDRNCDRILLGQQFSQKTNNDDKTRLCIFVIDGTWPTSRKTLRLSQNLARLPCIAFTPKTVSNFRVRKQPNDYCWSTIESIHHCVECLGPEVGFKINSRKHDQLIECFDAMVGGQMKFDPRFN